MIMDNPWSLMGLLTSELPRKIWANLVYWKASRHALPLLNQTISFGTDLKLAWYYQILPAFHVFNILAFLILPSYFFKTFLSLIHIGNSKCKTKMTGFSSSQAIGYPCCSCSESFCKNELIMIRSKMGKKP